MGDARESVFVVGNIGTAYTSKSLEMREDSVTVAEISSFQLETIDQFRPKVSAILNITEDHLNRHHTMEEYIRVKELITKNQGPEDVCVLNYEDEVLRKFGENIVPKVVYFSSLRKLDQGIYLDGDQIILKTEKEEIPIVKTEELKILGRHNHENVMAAAAMAYYAGVSVESIRKSVCEFVAVPHRIEYVTEKNGVAYYNDSKGTNPDAAIKGIQAMNRPTLLIGGGYDKESSYDEWIESFGGKVRRIEPVSDMQEIDELVESVKLDAIKEEKKLEKPFTPDVKKESAPKAAPAEEKKPVKKEAVQVEKASEEAPAKAAAPKERPARDFQGKAKPAREKQPRAPKERQPKETRERAPKQGRPIEILSDPEKIREVEERVVVFLRDVFGSMDLGEVEITSKYNTADGSLDVDFEGEDMGILIGKRGQTLDSLQYLTSLVVNKGESTYIRVKLDTEDYRHRRKETLENLARGIAFKVKKTRKPVVLEPMNPYERRIIHASLQGNRYVETVSEGEEPYRHVVVKLKRNN